MKIIIKKDGLPKYYSKIGAPAHVAGWTLPGFAENLLDPSPFFLPLKLR
jgi:hypothetical protein